MPLNLNLQVEFISKLELSPLAQRFEMQVCPSSAGATGENSLWDL